MRSSNLIWLGSYRVNTKKQKQTNSKWSEQLNRSFIHVMKYCFIWMSFLPNKNQNQIFPLAKHNFCRCCCLLCLFFVCVWDVDTFKRPFEDKTIKSTHSWASSWNQVIDCRQWLWFCFLFQLLFVAFCLRVPCHKTNEHFGIISMYKWTKS